MCTMVEREGIGNPPPPHPPPPKAHAASPRKQMYIMYYNYNKREHEYCVINYAYFGLF